MKKSIAYILMAFIAAFLDFVIDKPLSNEMQVYMVFMLLGTAEVLSS